MLGKNSYVTIIYKQKVQLNYVYEYLLCSEGMYVA